MQTFKSLTIASLGDCRFEGWRDPPWLALASPRQRYNHRLLLGASGTIPSGNRGLIVRESALSSAAATSFFESSASSSSSIQRGSSWPSCGASASTGQTDLRELRYSSEFGLWPWRRGNGRWLQRHR
ncbi:hypothetical protein LR48_Vigan08g084000 [Vigna angularis]|uniref:Uncharacterized protein n=1 Tax=Phaseolus angularis TaxID=3914 RepID=A0A0L9V4Z6_PHAAN|nr:hypothetical protein LR48_Vigan08g084000 [Vigna angularis]